MIPLPSGLQLHSSPKIEHPLLELLFVGAIGGLYDITLLVKVISGIQGIHLTICCRENEWQKEKINYLPFLNENITIVHKSGEMCIRDSNTHVGNFSVVTFVFAF